MSRVVEFIKKVEWWLLGAGEGEMGFIVQWSSFQVVPTASALRLPRTGSQGVHLRALPLSPGLAGWGKAVNCRRRYTVAVPSKPPDRSIRPPALRWTGQRAAAAWEKEALRVGQTCQRLHSLYRRPALSSVLFPASLPASVQKH